MASNRRHGQDQYARFFLLLTRGQGGISGRREANNRRMRARRKAARMLAMATLLSLFAHELFAVRPRSIWMRQRSTRWWEDVVLRSFGEHDWLENFRVSRDTFRYLCDQLRPVIKKQNTNMRRCVSLERRVAITLWVLATTAEYRTVGHLFGVARNTVSVIVHETCIAIVKVLLPKYIQFPSGNGLKEVMEGFKDKWGIPQCAGSIDGSHIPISPPAMNHTDYYNRKGWYSMLVQAVVDHEFLFRNLCVGWPGSVHDARVLANSSIYKKINNDQLLVGNILQFQGHSLRPFIIGDSAYPLLPWLIKPFSFSSSLSSQQKLFNYRVSRARVVVEIAFGRLKARWRRLSKQIEMDIDNVPHIISACCVLHNVCEVHGDKFNDDWLLEVDTQMAQPDDQQSSSSAQSVRVSGGDQVREILIDYFKVHKLSTG